MPVPEWTTTWTKSPATWVDRENSLRDAFKTFKIIESEVPRLGRYARKVGRLNQMPWKKIVGEIADGVHRQDAHLESARDMMNIDELRACVEDWRNKCETVNKLIEWQLFPRDSATKTLALFCRPGAYEQPFLC